jgi:superfamily II DNA or RNA helicase
MIELRPYQHLAINNLRGAIRSCTTQHKRILLQASTGSGKTIVACEMIRLALGKSKRALFIAHRKEIILQSSQKLDAFGIDHGIIMASHSRKNNHPVQVASIQTLTRRDKPEADLIIIDECHLSCSASYKQLIDEYPNAVIIGLTATPVRLDGRGLGEIYADIVEVVSMAQLIADGHLMKPRVFAPFTPDMKKVRTVKGDYDAVQTAAIMDNKKITGDIVKHWQSHARNHKTIVFASSVAHSKNIVAEFIAAGISAKHLDATTPASERDKTLAEWREGQFYVLSNMGLFVEGLDVPDASCCVLARPTKSVTIYLQAVGRIMRPAENKTECIILDHAGLTYEHNLVDSPRKWSLHGRIKKNKGYVAVAPVHVCEACFFAYSQIEHPNACPECGFQTPQYIPPKVRADGELVELTAEKMAWIKAKEKQKAIAEFKAAKTLEQLIELGKKRGYKPGWAYKMDAERKQWKENNSNSIMRFTKKNDEK